MDILDKIRIWSTTAVLTGALILILLERLFPYTRQKLMRKGFGTDFAMYSVVQSFVLGLIISYGIALIDQYTGVSRWEFLRKESIHVQLAIVFVVHDFYIYWFHRWQHHNPILWRIHEAHHSGQEIDWLSGSRSHSIEILINQTIEFAPIVLFCSPEIAVLKGCIDALWGMYIHSNVNVHTGWLQYVINGPEMHRWHHAIDDAARNKNFATKLAVWDWLFGTAYRPKHAKPHGYGLNIVYPTNYFKQHVYAFRRIRRIRK